MIRCKMMKNVQTKFVHMWACAYRLCERMIWSTGSFGDFARKENGMRSTRQKIWEVSFMGLFGKKDSKIMAQQTGRAVPITEVPDPVFAEKVLGDGIAIIPTSNTVVAPVSGTIAQVAHTFHAVGIEADDGTEVLVHLGIDTVKLNGEGFTCHVKVGDHVNVGDKLMDMDIEAIAAKGFQTISPCIVTTMDDLKNIDFITGDVTAGETAVMTYKKK